MDEEKKNELKKRLNRLIRRLVNEYPFFGELVLGLRLRPAKCGTAATDMEILYFDPDFAEKLSDEEMLFVIMHELMHCVLKHPIRGQGKEHYIYNVACDIVVNSNIFYYLGKKPFPVDGEIPMNIAPSGRPGKDLTAEEVYRELWDTKDPAFTDLFILSDEDMEAEAVEGDGEGSGGQSAGAGNEAGDEGGDGDGTGDGDGDGGETDESGNGKAKGSGKGKKGKSLDNHENWPLIKVGRQEKEWDEKIAKTLSKGWGSSAFPQAVLQVEKDKMKRARLRWKEILRDILAMYEVHTDYTFSPPDRRFNEGAYFLPGENEYEEDEVQNLWFCLDTSGSIDSTELSYFMGEARNILEEFPAFKGKISFFDDRITEPVPWSREVDIDAIKPIGGGGTSFACIFDYMKKHMKDDLPNLIVIMTDGWAEDVPPEAAMNVPVVWILIDNDEDKAFGKNIHISVEDYEDRI